MDTKATTSTAGQSAEELEAAFLEGAAPISEEGLELQRRYHELSSYMAPYKAEQDAIKELLLGEMASKGVTKLTYKGVPVAEKILTTRTKADLEAIIAKYPEVKTMYITQVPGSRFDAKKVVL